MNLKLKKSPVGEIYFVSSISALNWITDGIAWKRKYVAEIKRLTIWILWKQTPQLIIITLDNLDNNSFSKTIALLYGCGYIFRQSIAWFNLTENENQRHYLMKLLKMKLLSFFFVKEGKVIERKQKSR